MTKLVRKSIIIFLFCVCFTAAHAAPPIYNQTQLAASFMNFGYKEFDNNNTLIDQEYGLLPGITLSSDNRVRSLLMTGELSLYTNDVTYDGQTQTNVPIKSRTDTVIADFSLSITHILSGHHLIPERLYYGIGYRYWERKIRDSKTNKGAPVQGINETYRLPYLQIGSRWELARTESINWSLDLRLNHTVSAEMYVDLYDGTTLNLGERFGGRASILLSSSHNRGKNYYIEPFYEYWQIGKSDTRYNSGLGDIYEPRSTTNNLGINIGIQW